MRWIANINEPDSDLKRLMIYEYDGGAYLFGYDFAEDCDADWDEWYPDTKEARLVCSHEHGVPETEWTEIADPLPHCQHDWIKPVRVKGANKGNPEWGRMEE